jgi:hypothetical protein
MLDDGIAHRDVSLVVGHVGPVRSFADCRAFGGNAQPIAKMWVASWISVSAIAIGLPVGTTTPSARRASTVRSDSSACGATPRKVARYGSLRSAASLLKYPAAITLFAAPCSQTNTIVGDAVELGGVWGATVSTSAATGRIIVFISGTSESKRVLKLRGCAIEARLESRVVQRAVPATIEHEEQVVPWSEDPAKATLQACNPRFVVVLGQVGP